jgi:hypothetical protein
VRSRAAPDARRARRRPGAPARGSMPAWSARRWPTSPRT